MPRLAVGDVAPELALPAVGTADGSARFSLAEAVAEPGRRGVVVYFYPAAMTPGCTTEACDFRDSLASLQGAGYAVVGVSPDDVDKLARFAERDALTFPLVSDADHAVADAFGAWGVRKLYGKDVTGIIRSTVVVGPDGRVAVAQYNVKATGHVARLRKALGID
ncbi:alkyl hydroperoxide reductase/ Thiol specific antioxidant/ Mal allergen [Xylanimonas cellulosilytica DSM 15894]|uniref:thioredoxin-dependent peroxiredoxin n=1 Tax=Xylanimonas cellulosilytica (strain DSM 15894 / JCM 12276 / CECT 5975 / KCTC 9989 / LMG 20990 / NBRC 107835 / XIL07) TaxID=446471 RepID=D1BZE4_XYLCX|nr:peroxiredoxin [Xylanimonas cellulosilytica]ACZ30098.1 alkyl hydroperoxide reductase/ Thiol specific antioxidant/ Mal allergen [Xylanimonas cellulosilytica DSM 15894]